MVKADGGYMGEGYTNAIADVDSESSSRYARSNHAALQPPRRNDNALYTALWDFEARDINEISFQTGDIFQIVDSSSEWWRARKTDTNGCILATGFVPHNYLARVESLESQP